MGGDFVRLLGLGTKSIDDNAVSEAAVCFVPTCCCCCCCTDSSFSTGSVVAVDILSPEILFPTIVTGDDGGISLPRLVLLESWLLPALLS